MTPSPGLKAATAAAFLGLVGLLYAGLRPTVTDGARHIAIAYDGGAPAGTACVDTDAYASGPALALFAMATDGGPSYVHVRICAVALDDDAGTAQLPPGMLALDNDQVQIAYDGGPQLEAWLPGAVGAPFRCACAASSACLWVAQDGGWEPAPRGLTLQPGQFSGTCSQKVCTEFAGSISMPAECL